MRLLPEKFRVLLWIALVLAAGFLATCAAAYFVAREAVQGGIRDEALPMASEAIEAGLRARITRPVLIASAMASSSFERDWMARGEEESDAIIRYLEGIQREYGASDAFLVSERTRGYYTAQGISRIEQEGNAGDTWLYRTRDAKLPFVAEISIDRANGNALTIVINHRITSRNGHFLGIAGVAMRMDGLTSLFNRHEKDGRRIYVVDGKRRIVLAGGTPPSASRSIEQVPGIGEMADQLLPQDGKPVLRDYRHEGRHMFASARALPELGWHLIVEQDAADDVEPVWNAFMLTLAAGAVVTLLVLALVLATIRRYDRQLEQMAGTDMLTGLLNRQAFDFVFRQAMLDADRGSRPTSCIVFDIDLFRRINETCGHPAGDEVLRTVARIARAMLRESDVITRWGGEEFIVLLKECTLEQAVAVAEKLRHSVDQHDFMPAVPDGRITISLGVAQHETGETAMRFLQRADEALAKAKANGRNRLQVARTGAMEGSTAGEAL
ncbi:sensor domain-containing diguanylate cyclase [Noviherbaspirillum sp. ST9]|uniref:sensor domain-containing diguanylate cyclase n=1 Tax=Noviherbaspirillum sp. ST9 TaxID=3401606 RepID=UPI003B58A8DC